MPQTTTFESSGRLAFPSKLLDDVFSDAYKARSFFGRPHLQLSFGGKLLDEKRVLQVCICLAKISLLDGARTRKSTNAINIFSLSPTVSYQIALDRRNMDKRRKQIPRLSAPFARAVMGRDCPAAVGGCGSIAQPALRYRD